MSNLIDEHLNYIEEQKLFKLKRKKKEAVKISKPLLIII